MKRIFIILLLLLVEGLSSFAQKIILSHDIRYKSSNYFELLGKVDDKILLFKQKGFKYRLDVFNEKLELQLEKELFFEKQNIHFNCLVPGDTSFTIIYSYSSGFSEYIHAARYGPKGNVLDSTLILEQKEFLGFGHYSYVLSEDKGKVLLFRKDDYNSLNFILFDLISHRKLWQKTLAFDDFRIEYDSKHIVLTNDGLIFLSFENYNYAFRRKKHFHQIYSINPENTRISNHRIDFNSKLAVDFNMVVDEKNGEIVVAGLYAPKSNRKAQGYFLYKLKEENITSNIEFHPFSHGLLRKMTKHNRKQKKYITDLKVRDIVIRNDGGLVLISEMQKEVARESLKRKYVDYHFEDMVLLGIHPDGELFWEELIRKYQLSYDDLAIYSSYFLFKTPSILKIIFNDEIQDENTISEYVFSPLGNGKRNSLFSTDLHRLKLLIDEAIQISSHSFVVPSLHSGEYRIIKLSY